MILRYWEEKDIPVIADMEKECFPDPWSEEALRASFVNNLNHCFLVEDGGQVRGYCIMFCLFEDAEVLNIAVEKSARGKGYGTTLMNKMHQTAKSLGATQCFLEVRVSNQTAIALYEKFGYCSYGVRERYYADGENAFVMKTTL